LAINTLLPGGAINGWDIPKAIDTAIAVGVLAALYSPEPRSMAAFLVGGHSLESAKPANAVTSTLAAILGYIMLCLCFGL
jgi:Na+/H+ antiporter NhaA